MVYKTMTIVEDSVLWWLQPRHIVCRCGRLMPGMRVVEGKRILMKYECDDMACMITVILAHDESKLDANDN
jgi:hypothetical protein